MKKMIWLTTAFVLFMVFVAPAILGLALDIIPAADQPGYNSDKRLAIYGKRGVTQKFVSKEKNLTAIGTSIRNPNLKNKKEVILNLYDANGVLIRTSVLNGQNLEDGGFVKFVFGAIPNSMEQKYSFTLLSPTASSEETIEVFYNDLPTDDILEFTYDEKVYEGGIPLVTYHRPDSKFSVVNEIYSNLFSRLLQLDSQKL